MFSRKGEVGAGVRTRWKMQKWPICPKSYFKIFKNWPRKRVTFLRVIYLPCLDLILSTFVPNVQIVQIRNKNNLQN